MEPIGLLSALLIGMAGRTPAQNALRKTRTFRALAKVAAYSVLSGKRQPVAKINGTSYHIYIF